MKRPLFPRGIYPAPLSRKKGGAGFTIPELLVSLFVFSLVFVSAGGLLISGIGVQRKSGVQQELMDQASYLAEYVSRALRQVRKELVDVPSNCLTTAGRGFNYELNPAGDLIRFLNRNNSCQQFFLSGTQIFEQTSADSTAANFGSQVALTSDNLQVTRLGFFISGAGQGDNLQPKATFVIELNGEARMQTTVSQRKIDVPQ